MDSQAYRLLQGGCVGDGKLAYMTRFITGMHSEMLHPITYIRRSVDTTFDAISHAVDAEVQRGTAPGDIIVVFPHGDDAARTLCDRLPNSVYVSADNLGA